MVRIIISILLCFIGFQSHSQMPMFHAHNQACDGTITDVNAQQFIDSTGITNVNEKCAINQLVIDLKAAGLWSKMYLIYPFVGGTAERHRFNLKNPTEYKITWRVVLTDGANGTTNAGRTHFTSTQLIDSAGSYNLSLGVYHPRHPSLANSGAYGGGSNDGIWIGQGATSIYSILYYFTGAAETVNVASTATGMYHMNRSSQTRQDVYLNGVSIGNSTSSTSRTGSTAGEFNINQVQTSGTSGSQSQMRFFWLGDSFDTTESANIYTIIQRYQTTLGRQL